MEVDEDIKQYGHKILIKLDDIWTIWNMSAPRIYRYQTILSNTERWPANITGIHCEQKYVHEDCFTN